MECDDITISNRIQLYDLAPTKIKTSEVLEIAQCILESLGFYEENNVTAHVFSKSINAIKEQALTNVYDMTTIYSQMKVREIVTALEAVCTFV